MHPLINLEDSYSEEDSNGNSQRKPSSSEPTWETIHSSKKYAEEKTLETNPVTSPNPSAPSRKNNKGHLDPGDIMKYQKGSDLPRFATLEEHNK